MRVDERSARAPSARYGHGNFQALFKSVNAAVLLWFAGVPGTDAAKLVLGFVLRGSGQRTLLMRGAGPALAQFHVASPLPDPRLALYDADAHL